VFIDMIMVGAVKMPVVQVIDVIFVFDRGVAASGAVGMGVLIVGFVRAHSGCLLSSTSFFWAQMGLSHFKGVKNRFTIECVERNRFGLREILGGGVEWRIDRDTLSAAGLLAPVLWSAGDLIVNPKVRKLCKESPWRPC
jgi:hypothetical protein